MYHQILTWMCQSTYLYKAKQSYVTVIVRNILLWGVVYRSFVVFICHFIYFYHILEIVFFNKTDLLIISTNNTTNKKSLWFRGQLRTMLGQVLFWSIKAEVLLESFNLTPSCSSTSGGPTSLWYEIIWLVFVVGSDCIVLFCVLGGDGGRPAPGSGAGRAEQAS